MGHDDTLNHTTPNPAKNWTSSRIKVFGWRFWMCSAASMTGWLAGSFSNGLYASVRRFLFSFEKGVQGGPAT